ANKIIFAYQLMIILRLYFAGLAFTYFANHFDLKKSVIIPGAMVYIFNAYLLYANVAQPFFTTAFIIFPLIILGLEKVLQEKSDRKSTRLNSSHVSISYAVFCLKK